MKIEKALKEKLEEAFQPVYLHVQNDSHGHSRGHETHFTVVVVSSLFVGKSRVDRSRMIASLFDQEREAGLHALSQRAFTPEEWDKVKDNFQVEPPACHGGGATAKTIAKTKGNS